MQIHFAAAVLASATIFFGQAAHAQTGPTAAVSAPPTATQPVPAIATVYPTPAAGLGPRVGRYFQSRWAEDWSRLRNRPADAPRELFDPLKFIPIAGDGAVYATLSGENRVRLNYVTDPGLRRGRDQDQFLVRTVIGADVHLGRNLRVYGELNSAQVFGANPLAITPNQRNALFVQQLFAEASGTIGGTLLGARVGRQEFMDGPPILINIRPAPDIYSVLDGVRLSINGTKARATLFSFNTVRLGRHAFDDPTNPDEGIDGATTSFVVPAFAGAKLFFDPFVFRYHKAAQRWGTTVGREHRSFYGARLWGTIGDGTIDITALGQGGSFAGRDIDAQAVFTNLGYLLDKGALHPRVGLHVDVTSGGGAYGTGPLRNFNYFYAPAPYFSWGVFFGPTNLKTVGPNFRITPAKGLTLTTEIEWLRRSNEFDAVYNNQGNPYAGTQRVRGKDIGELLRVDLKWEIGKHLTGAIWAEHLRAGSVLTRAGFNDTNYVGVETAFRF
ncbi:alginate export family protein [Sphingomonas sp. Tas61C01]|uniref:alginate export family protein n=1 Tax=Sphingomonas sp. Tas61C01 TaxID=3458297 RepID=UPI00403ED0B4